MRGQAPGPDRRVALGLDASLRRAAAVAGIAWQAVAIWTVYVTDPTRPRWHLLVAHLAICGLVLLLLTGRRYVVLVGLGCYATWAYDFASAPSIDSALCLSACWLGNMIHLGAVLLFRSWFAVACPIVAAAVGSLAARELNPALTAGLVSGNIVTAATIAVGGKLAMRYLRSVVDGADDMADRVLRERQATTLVTRAARRVTDHARLLHDTVINTLGAIANGGVGPEDVEFVRDRCREDLEALGVVLDGADARPGGSFAAITGGSASRIRVLRTGLDTEEVARVEAQLPAEVHRALLASIGELIRNAEKHAGVDLVELDLRVSGGALVVTVADRGVGFDGEIPEGRGLANSVIARLAEVGASVDLDSARRSGTRAVITCPIDGSSAHVPEGAPLDEWSGPEAVIEQVRWRACWSWAIAVVTVGVVIEAVNRPGVIQATYLMLAVVAAASAIAWWSSRPTRVAPGWCLALLVVLVPVAFDAGMAGAGFGTGDVYHYQAWGVTPLLIALLTLGRRKAPFVVGLVVLAAAALATMVAVGRSSGLAVAAVVVVGVAPAFGLALGWLGFHTAIARILRGAETARRVAMELRLEATARIADIGVRKRWRAAELRDAVAVLQGLADGALSPLDPDVRRRCGMEESYIRQLIQLSPDAFRMGPPLARALAAAHTRSIALTVRTGSVDAPDESTAETLGALVDDAVRAVPAGGSMTVGVFESGEDALLTMVAPEPHLAARISSWKGLHTGWDVVRETFGGQDLIEIRWPAVHLRRTVTIAGVPGGVEGGSTDW